MGDTKLYNDASLSFGQNTVSQLNLAALNLSFLVILDDIRRISLFDHV